MWLSNTARGAEVKFNSSVKGVLKVLIELSVCVDMCVTAEKLQVYVHAFMFLFSLTRKQVDIVSMCLTQTVINFS